MASVVNTFIQDDVSLLYIAFFGRAPDARGFSYWTQEMAATPGTNTEAGAAAAAQNLAMSFGLSREFQDRYGSLTPEQQVNTFYRNVLNRDADTAGLDYWVNEIVNNDVPFSTVAWQIVYAAFQGGETVDPLDTALVNNKGSVSQYFAETLASNDLSAADSAFAVVTSDPATVTQANSQLLIATANQIVLTPRVETYYGASGNNTFDAMGFVTSTGSVVQTLQNGDTLVGSVNGTNTLKANLIDSGTVTPNGLTNIQQLVLTNVDGTGFDLTNGAEVNSITLNALGANLSIDNAQSSDISYSVTNTSRSASAYGGSQRVVGLDLNTAAAAGSGDIADLTVTNSSISLNLDTGYESLFVSSIGSNTISSNFSGDVTISGEGNFVLTGSSAATISTTDIDTTQLTGTFQTDFGSNNTVFVGGDGATTITNGAGANTITLGNGTNSVTSQLSQLNNDTLTGGSGLNTLILSAQTVDVGGTTAETALTNVSNFDVLTLSSAGTNSLTIGTQFVEAGFTTITGSASNDLVVASNVALTDLTFNGGAGTDTFTFNNTASGTVTVSSVDVVNSGSAPGVANQTVNINDVSTATLTGGYVDVTLDAGTADTVNIGANSSAVSVRVSGVEFVNSGNSVTGNTVVLANDSTAVTVTGGAGNLTIDAQLASTAANSFLFGNATNTLQIDELATISNAASVNGGTGVDTLQLTAQLVGGADGSFAKVNNFETLTLSNAGTNSLTIGTNFIAADFTTITGSASNDLVIASNAAFSGLTFNGGAGTDTLTLNTASGTITINSVEVVTSTGSSDIDLSVANGASAPSINVDLGAGTDTLRNLNTAGLTVTLSGAETYLGSIGVDTVTLGSGGAITINGGGGTDSVTLSVNTSNVTVLAGSGAAMSVIGNLAATNDSLAIQGAGTYNLTSVETVTVSGAEVSTINAWLFTTDAATPGTAGNNALFTYNLSNNDVAAFTMRNQTAGVTGGSVLLTVNADDNATITFNNSALIAGQTGAALIVTQDDGYTSITLGGTSSDSIQTNLGGLSVGTSTADSFIVSNFGSAGSDTIDLTGATLTSGLGVNTVLRTAYLNASGLQNTDTFTLNTTFVTGNSTTLANISNTSGANQNAVIFNFGMGSTTANFTTQAGIDTAVSYITGNIGTTTSGSQSAVLAVSDGNGRNALFLFQDDGTSGIDASDLKLIGVVTGSVSASTFV